MLLCSSKAMVTPYPRHATNQRAFGMRALTDPHLYADERVPGQPLPYLHLDEDNSYSSY